MIKYIIAVFILSILVAGAVIFAILRVGLPSQARGEKFDQKRLQNMSSLKTAIEGYYYKNNKLPKSPSDLSDDYTKNNLEDPETETEYVYDLVGEKYQLCAKFDTDNRAKTDGQGSAYLDKQFPHPKGYYCFEYEVPIISKISSLNNGDQYFYYASSIYNPSTKKRTKVAQSVKTYGDQTIKGIKARYDFTAGGKGHVSLREFSNESDLEAGTLLWQGDINAEILNEKRDQTLIFDQPVTLFKDKTYVFIFESADEKTVVNLSYSYSDMAPTGMMYVYDTVPGPGYDSNKYVWTKHNSWDLFFHLE